MFGSYNLNKGLCMLMLEGYAESDINQVPLDKTYLKDIPFVGGILYGIWHLFSSHFGSLQNRVSIDFADSTTPLTQSIAKTQFD